MSATQDSGDIDELNHRAHKDLTARARGGIMIYMIGWLALTVPMGMPGTHPAFFTFNTVCIALVMAGRICHLIVLRKETPQEVSFAYKWLVWNTLAGALHWGLMAAWAILHAGFERFEFNVIASAAVLGIGGTTALCISNELRVLFPNLILVPIIVALTWQGSTDNLVLATMAVIALVYVTITARTTRQDYWQAISNHLLAEKRATEMEELSVTDQLTRLKNRAYFDTRFGDEWKRGDRQQTPLSVLMVDLDHFKSLNDTYGHVFGDEVLRHTAEVLQAQVYRESDLVARYGGEEFVVLLPNTDAEGTAVIAERIRYAVADIKIACEDEWIDVRCSIGGATAVPHRLSEREALLKCADAALYESKAAGRNRYTASAESYKGTLAPQLELVAGSIGPIVST